LLIATQCHSDIRTLPAVSSLFRKSSGLTTTNSPVRHSLGLQDYNNQCQISVNQVNTCICYRWKSSRFHQGIPYASTRPAEFTGRKVLNVFAWELEEAEPILQIGGGVGARASVQDVGTNRAEVTPHVGCVPDDA